MSLLNSEGQAVDNVQALQLLEFLVKNGSERVVDDARSHLSLIRMLRQFHYIDQNGKDQGINVRNRSGELAKLLGDVEMIRAERKKARANKNKYGGVEGGPGLGGFSSGAGRYGGFGSEQGGFGTYQGEVYGDGGGYGGRETDFSGTQRRGDQFEEYDEEDDGATRPSASRATVSTAAAKRAPAKKKEPEPDLFDFGEEETTTSTSNGKAPAINAMDDFGPVQEGGAGDEDDFDDFQSAASPSGAQPAANPLAAALSPPPPTTFTTTSATQFAQPKPMAPANMSSIFAQNSGPPSTASPAPSSVASPPPQPQNTPLQAVSTQYKPTGPNYYASVNTSINTGPSATSAFSSRPTMSSNASQASYKSSTSAATLGKPTAQPMAGGGSDAFANLWSTAGTTAGVQKKPGSKGPDLASMAKAKSEAGLWGAPAGQSMAAPGGQRPGAVAPSPNTATGTGRPNQPLGNGLDDLLG